MLKGCPREWCKSLKVALEVVAQMREKESGTTFSVPGLCLISQLS